MNYHSFGKISVKLDQIKNFIHDAQSKGLTVKHVKANIYEIGVALPTLHDLDTLRKTAGMIGLKYTQS
ncbi:MAG: hypothetical protein HWE34_02025 [Methylocystaceae bacterium]|nr:hypothetical protein [Methylocystaceae bacterium]